MNEGISVLEADPHDQTLVANVHPRDWVNPTPAPRYNLVVLGAGTGGLVSAAGAAGLGARVALVEKHFFGGDCLNAGCVPSKGVIRASRAAADARSAAEFGIDVPAPVRVDFSSAMERMRHLRALISKNDSVRRFQKLGVDVFLGEGHFTGRDAVEVGGTTLRFRKAVIATGTRPAVPPIPGLREAGFLTNETVFSLTSLPPRLGAIGAGPIGCELVQAFARLGSLVNLFGNQSQVLPREDRNAAQRVERAMVRDGVHLVLGSNIVKVEKDGADKVLRYERGGETEELRVDEILVAVGRKPNVEELDLGAAGVAYDAKEGVHVNDRLQTTNRRVFAAGDICSRYKFTHAADAQARLVLRNALFFGHARASALVIPWCTYTDPEIAHVGLSERDAEERGIEMQTFIQEFDEVDRAILDGETDGCVKVHVRKGTDKILGATIVARHAGDMIGELTLAMVAAAGLGTLANTIHPYPTQAEAIKKVGDAYNRTRLTPFVKGLFEKWFAWRR